MPNAWLPRYSTDRRKPHVLAASRQCLNLIETCRPFLGLKQQKSGPKSRAYYSSEIPIRIMLIFMLGLLLATAILALKTASNVKEMLVPVPVRAR